MNFIKSIFHITRSVIFSLLLICIVIFMVNNRDIISIHLYPLPFNIETRMFVVMIAVFLLGLLFGILACSQSLVKRSINSFSNRQKIGKLEKKITKS